MECLPSHLQFYPEVVTFYIKYPSFWPANNCFFLYGIVSALTTNGEPCSAKVIFKKTEINQINTHAATVKQEDIMNEEYGKEVLKWISNEVESNKGLTAFQPDFLTY